MTVHEIANGPDRQKFLDQPCGLLVVCYRCNADVLTDKKIWPIDRQLWLLREKNPSVFDLNRFNELSGRNITLWDVDQWSTQYDDLF